MRKISAILFSTKTSLALMAVFTIAIATATFVEDRYDTATARVYIYNAKWFELVMLLLMLNFFGNIRKYNLWSPEKASGLLFHSAFGLMILGAAITRYGGTEGNMPIREGAESDVYYSSDPYIIISMSDSYGTYKQEEVCYLTEFVTSPFNMLFNTLGSGKTKITFSSYQKNAIEKFHENAEEGRDILEFTISASGNSEKIILYENESAPLGNYLLSYNGDNENEAIKISGPTDNLSISFPFAIDRYSLKASEKIPPNTVIPLNSLFSYQFRDINFFLSSYYQKAVKVLVPAPAGQQGSDKLMVNVMNGNQKKQLIIPCQTDQIATMQTFNVNGLKVNIGYGHKEIKLPFTIRLDDFILDRYAGSNSPSSFASFVTLSDPRTPSNAKHRIYMNNVLDYDGYRFFQSGYDMDEHGTILSVNKDSWGTGVTYFSYLLLGLGMLLTLFNKNSRFYSLIQQINALGSMRKTMVTLVAIIINAFLTSAIGQNDSQSYIAKAHSEKFGRLIVQGHDGRFQPISTLAYDVMRKISRKERFSFPDGHEMGAPEVFINILINPELWKKKKIIYIREESVKKVLRITGNHASFDDFFDHANQNKIQHYVEAAFRKKPAEQNKFDKEILRVDERVNILMMVMRGELLKIFPGQNSADNSWQYWNDSLSYKLLEGSINHLNDEFSLPVFNYNNLFRLYFTELIYSSRSSDYTKPDRLVEVIGQIQQQLSPPGLLPTKSMVEFEIQYNDLNIFGKLKNMYGILGIIMLLLIFTDHLKKNSSRVLRVLLFIFTAITAIAFAFHTYGMGLRWYITGHAPWSNGYETLLFIAWSSLLAGFSFLRYGKITLAATSMLAFFTLMTAGHSNYDPQLTNLQPVLKSYWLIIHVATLVISYGFFGLSVILGLFSLLLYLFTGARNYQRNILIIKEWTFINEMTITIGLVLATAGTFLGGVWANESWGRYWGWDAKETWALVIIIVYSIVLHLRLVPKLRGWYVFTVSAVAGFGSVLMTFFGVNYYLSKGLHSYASGGTPVFPVWAWLAIATLFVLFLLAAIKEKRNQTFFNPSLAAAPQNLPLGEK